MSLIQGPSTAKFSGKTVTVVGAGVSGLCITFELKRRGFAVQILEASSRVGGRVITFRDPVFAPGLHAEGGAMRIPGNHFFLRQYLDDFGLTDNLFDFEMKNKFIYLSGVPEGKRTLIYTEFDRMLLYENPDLMALFPGLKEHERGKTCDQLFDAAVRPVKELWNDTYEKNAKLQPKDPSTGHMVYDEKAIELAYDEITKVYDGYTLRSYLTDVTGWSLDATFDLAQSRDAPQQARA